MSKCPTFGIWRHHLVSRSLYVCAADVYHLNQRVACFRLFMERKFRIIVCHSLLSSTTLLTDACVSQPIKPSRFRHRGLSSFLQSIPFLVFRSRGLLENLEVFKKFCGSKG